MSNPTWQDIKQLGWSVMLVVPFIAIGVFGLAGMVGARTAIWVGVGLVCFIAITFLLIVSMNLVGSYVVNFVNCMRKPRK